MPKNPMVASEKDWEAQNDADTLARAEEIKADNQRMKRAAKAAADMEKEAAVRAKAMKSIASKGKKKPARPKKKAGGVKRGKKK